VSDDRPATDFIRRRTKAAPTFWEDDSDVLSFLQSPARNDPLKEMNHGNRLADPDVVDEAEPVPNAAYVATDYTNSSWLLFIDIDAKDVALERATEAVTNTATKTEAEIRDAAGIIDAEPAGYDYAFRDIDRALELGFQVHDIMVEQLNMADPVVQYSGQGCHVFGPTADSDHRYDTQSREYIVDILTTKYEIPIDEKCTTDRSRFTRLPFSLHGDVGQVVTPIDSPSFDYRTEAQAPVTDNDLAAEQ
ncbi:hypothetical protein SAMN05216388_11121, partial [Halorientalis persicus]